MLDSRHATEHPDEDLVSVVIPVYNAESYLQETLESVLNQTHRSLEIVAVDDGSEDRSLELLKEYSKTVKVVTQPNCGAAAARNRGAREAKGRWIAFVDADDTWHPQKLEKQLQLMRGLSWAYSDVMFMGGVNDGRRDSDFNAKFHGQVLPQLVCNNFISTSTVLVDRALFLSLGGFTTSLMAVEDWELWIRIAANHDVAYLNEPVVDYRVHSKSVSRSTRKSLPNHMALLTSVFAEGGPASHLRHLMPRAIGNSCAICAQIAEEEGDYGFSLYCAFAACRNEWLRASRWSSAAKSIVKYIMSWFAWRGYSAHMQSAKPTGFA